MNIVYCHLDYSLTNFKADSFSFNQLPEYALDSIKQSRFYNESSNIFLICNLKNVPDETMKVLKDLNVKIVEQNSLLSDKIKKMSAAYSNLKIDYNLANFNFVSMIRYAFIEELMRTRELCNVFHLEYDNLLYINLDLIEKFFNGDCIFHNVSNTGLCGGTAFFRNVEAISKMNDEMLRIFLENKDRKNISYFNDQIVLSKIRHDTDLISYFEDFSINGVKYIFDPADFGQFLGGTNIGHPPGFMNKGNRLYDFIRNSKDRMSFFSNKTGLYMELDGVFHKFVNLHVHNKNAIKKFITFNK